MCKLCGRNIPFDLVHGDHVEPWIEGGRTVAENLQALCGSCNLRKGRLPQAVARARFDADLVTAGQPGYVLGRLRRCRWSWMRSGGNRCWSRLALARVRPSSAWNSLTVWSLMA